MTREQVELLIGRALSNDEWREISQLLHALHRHPDGDAFLDRCVEQGASIETLMDELKRS